MQPRQLFASSAGPKQILDISIMEPKWIKVKIVIPSFFVHVPIYILKWQNQVIYPWCCIIPSTLCNHGNCLVHITYLYHWAQVNQRKIFSPIVFIHVSISILNWQNSVKRETDYNTKNGKFNPIPHGGAHKSNPKRKFISCFSISKE